MRGSWSESIIVVHERQLIRINYCGSWEAADQNQLLWFRRGSWSESIIVVHERQLIRINYCGSWEAADQNQLLWFTRGSWSESIIVAHERQLIRINYCGSWEAADQNQFKPQSHYSWLLTFYSSFRFIFFHSNRILDATCTKWKDWSTLYHIFNNRICATYNWTLHLIIVLDKRSTTVVYIVFADKCVYIANSYLAACIIWIVMVIGSCTYI
jgi:hypothetical protein